LAEAKIVRSIWLVVAVLLFAGVILWGYLDQNHYISHSKVAQIASSAWHNHQTKECASWNCKSAQPVVECDGGHSELMQTVPVRFYGDTRRELEPDTLRFHWTCERREESRPAISCRIAS
jgi:hypothetical protein